MLKFNTKGKNGEFNVTLPTTLAEITPEYLNKVTKDVVIADHFCLIGICYREQLSSVIFANNTNKGKITTSVVPIFVKAGATDTKFINNIKPASKLVVAPSDIALGHHIAAPSNKITIDNVVSCVTGDKNIYQQSLAYKAPCYFLEFKIIPECAIHGCYNNIDAFDYSDTPNIEKVG